MPQPHLPTRTLRERPDLDHLRRQAKQLLQAFTRGDPAAVAEVNAHYRGGEPSTFALHDAQLVIARAYGFESWPRLKAFVDGVTVRRLIAAARAQRLDEVRALLRVRPELARMSQDNLQVVHHAVLARAPEIVRLLMSHGADARAGVYPHPDATSAYAIADQRGDAEIVGIIESAEAQRRQRRHDIEPSPLQRAAFALDPAAVAALLDAGADPSARGFHGLTALDAAAYSWYRFDEARFAAVARLLLERGAKMTAAAAVALGDVAWLRATHEAGGLSNAIEDAGGLLRIAVTHNRLDVLRALLDAGFDPDERTRVGDGDEVVVSWGMPLQAAAASGRYEFAELLLARGADPNGSIYASGDPMFSAYAQKDAKMVTLLERYGGTPAVTTAGLFRQVDLARRMCSGEARYRLAGAGGATVAEQLLWGAACGGSPEIVCMALERVDWARDDPRWFEILEQPLRAWTHGRSGDDLPRESYLACFRLVLERCDPDLRGRPTDRQQFGLTTLHNLVARGNLTPGERVAFAIAMLDRGARLDTRDHLLRSTPLGWACRWGALPLVKLFLDRGADPVEADAEPWATPLAWARRMNQREITTVLTNAIG